MDNGSDNGSNGHPKSGRSDSDRRATGPASTPDGETLRMWMSAYLDGELPAADEATLMAAVDADPELAFEFEHMCRFFVADASSAGLSAPDLNPDDSRDLQDAIFAATAPALVSETPNAAALLASQAHDGELSSDGTDRLRSLTSQPAAARAAQALLFTAEATQVAVRAPAEDPEALESLAFATGAVMDTVAADERAGITMMAFGDGEASVDELEKVLSIADSDRLSAVHLLPDAMDGIQATLRSVMSHPAAAKAGAAALQAIAAEAALASSSATETAPKVAPAPITYFDRLRSALSSLAAPLVIATGAAALFVGVGADFGPPRSSTKTPPIPSVIDPSVAGRLVEMRDPTANNPVKSAWLQTEMFTAWASELMNDETALREFDVLEVLADNSATEVQTLETGAASTMVFSTEASNITVIWVPDADADEGASDGDDAAGSATRELGT